MTEFGRRAGTPALHTLRGKVHAEPREILIPPDRFQRFANDAFFRDPQRMPKNRRIVFEVCA